MGSRLWDGNEFMEETGIKIGYARVSTEDQRMDMQVDALIAAGVSPDHIFQESISGVKSKRPELQSCLKALRKGDTLVIFKLDRLGRSVVELLKLVTDLEARGVAILSIRDAIDTKTAVGRVMFHMLAAFAQFERDIISERTKAGMKAARARGHRGGRKSKIDSHKLKGIIAMLSDPTVLMEDVAKTFGVGRSTIQRAIAKANQTKTLKELQALEKEKRKLAKTAPVRTIIEELV
jgi:DNA invertase Pin-like site-specific DNA recombinase